MAAPSAGLRVATSPEAVMGLIRAENVLFDASLACGMSYDEPVVEAWAVQRVTRFLCEA
jgi:hypothetical protein